MFYPESIPYLKMTKKIIYLPKGEPIGKGNVIFLFTNNRKESYDIVNSTTSMRKGTFYRYYYYNLRYRGKINGRPYKVNLLKMKKTIKREIEDNTSLISPLVNPILGSDKHSLYFDMSEYYSILKKMIEPLSAIRKVPIFWNYIKSIILEQQITKKYDQKYLLINIENFPNMSGSFKEKINNPLFLLYYTLYRTPELIKDIDMDFLIFAKDYTIKINPSKCDKNSYRTFMIELKKLYNRISVDTEKTFDTESISTEESEDIVVDAVKKSFHFTGNQTVEVDETPDVNPITKEKKSSGATKAKTSEEVVNKIISDKTKKVIETSNADKSVKEIQADVEKEIDEDKEAIKELYKVSREKKVPVKSAASTARDAMLRKNIENIKVNNMTVKDLKKIKPGDVEIESTDVSASLHTTNKNMGTVKFANFNKTYINKVMTKDISDSITALSEKSLPLFVRKVNVEDTSDELNYVDTYTIEFEDANRVRSTIKVDIPKFIDNKFMWLGGNKKLILNQNFLLPVVKTSNDTVQIVTNYNKMFITRDDVKSLGTIDKLTKIVNKTPELQKEFEVADVSSSNKGYITTIEYDELSKMFSKFNGGGCTIYFDQAEADKYVHANDVKVPSGFFCVGRNSSGPIFIDLESQRTKDGESIVDIIVKTFPEAAFAAYNRERGSKRLMYAKVKSMDKYMPVIVLTGFWEGLSKVMTKMDLKYRIVDSYPKDIAIDEIAIRFKDSYLVFKDIPFNSLLMNGLRQLPTEQYNLADFDSREPYLDFIKKTYGRVSVANALDNYYEFTVDPITKEVCEDLNLPTDIVGLMLYAVKLLNDNQYTLENSEKLYRIRNAEIIPAILYDALAKNYINYKNSNGRKKFTVPRDIVIKNLLELKTVEDYSTLNPNLEMQRTHTLSAKGWRGINLDDSFTIDKRAYDDSMVGVVAVVTPPDGQCGVSRTLTMEPKIKSVRGYVETTDKKDYDKLKDTNLFALTELTIPLSGTRDDPNRLGHAIKQSGHVIPVKKSSPVLISNGAEEACRFQLSSDFVVNAEEDGYVKDVDENAKIMIIEYKSGKHQAVNLAPTIVKNGGGGFYESNTLVTNLKLGDKVKANQALAWHKEFFTQSNANGTRLNMGTLTKVAILSAYNTYEDATFITDKLSRDAASDMCFQKSVVLGKNSNVSRMVKIGDSVEVGDTLIQFDSSFEDESLNEFLAVLGKDPALKEEILDSSKNTVKAKTAGTIEDIKIFATVDIDEMSPSLQKIVKAYYSKINQRKKILDKYDDGNGSIVKCGMLLTDTTSKVAPNKFGVIRGQKIEEGVLIEFYIKHTELLEVGSKIAMFTGIKNTIAEILPKGYEPYSEFRKDEEISSVIAENSVLARMTPSIILSMFGNKCLIELKRKIEDIWHDPHSGNEKNNLIKNLVYKFFASIDKTGKNVNRYKTLFEGMTDSQFTNYFKQFVSDPDAYLTLDIVDYENSIVLEDIERAAKVLNVPLFEYVYLPYVTMDKDMVVKTKLPVPVGYIHIKRTQQTIMKKNGIATSSDIRSALTGQVTAADKSGRETDLENSLLASQDLDWTLKELNGPRGDDVVMQNAMLKLIANEDAVTYSKLPYDISNKTTLNTVNVFLLGMGIESDLVNKGLMLQSTVKKELK